MNVSDVDMGAILLQEYLSGVDHPVCYYSRKFDSHHAMELFDNGEGDIGPDTSILKCI